MVVFVYLLPLYRFDSISSVGQIALSNNSRLETVRVKHLSQINKFESEVRALEVTVNTLGNFISTLAYGRTEIEIPNDVLRILSQLNFAERRRSLPKASLTDLNSDSDSSKDQHITLGQLKSNSLSPKSASSYFSKSFDQIRQQKLNLLANSGNGSKDSCSPANNNPNQLSSSSSPPRPDVAEKTSFTKSLSDTRNLKFDRIVEESSDRTQSLGRTLTNHDLETLKLFQKNYSKEQRSGEPIRGRLLKSSHSSFELGTANGLQPDVELPAAPAVSDAQYHPLSCGGIHISYSESKKLKSLRPSRIKSEVQINVPRNFRYSTESGEDEGSVNGHSCNENNNDSAFDESIESIDSNGNLADKVESTANAVRDSKMSNADVTIS